MPQSGTKDNPAVNTPSPSAAPVSNPGDAQEQQAKINQKLFAEGAAEANDPDAKAAAETLANRQATEDGEYVLRDNVGTHTVVEEDGKSRKLEAGERVKLTAAQIRAFGDKFSKA